MRAEPNAAHITHRVLIIDAGVVSILTYSTLRYTTDVGWRTILIIVTFETCHLSVAVLDLSPQLGIFASNDFHFVKILLFEALYLVSQGVHALLILLVLLRLT